MMSLAPASITADVKAALVECALKTEVSTPTWDNAVLRDLVMVAAVTGLKALQWDRNKGFISPGLLKALVFLSYSLRVDTGHSLDSSLKTYVSAFDRASKTTNLIDNSFNDSSDNGNGSHPWQDCRHTPNWSVIRLWWSVVKYPLHQSGDQRTSLHLRTLSIVTLSGWDHGAVGCMK